MRWCVAIALISLIGIGCRAPAPTLDPFGPYGNRVIPPPGTGSIGSPNGYYQPASVPAPYPGPGGSTSRNPLQPVPSLATPPSAPRTSSLPNDGSWKSSSGGNNGFGYATPRPSQTVAASPRFDTTSLQQSPNLDWGGYTSQVAPTYAQAPSTVFIPSAPAPQQFAGPSVAPAQYAQPVPFRRPSYPAATIRPSTIRPSIITGTYVDSSCCEPLGDTALIPRADPTLASAPFYYGAPQYYGAVTTAQPTGWRRRR